MTQKTPLYDEHISANAKMVDFHGWSLPIHYGSQLEEHHTVRKACGLFDVSHMTIVDVTGPDAQIYLRYALANDVLKLAMPGRALYTAMLNESGGILDDLIVYKMQDNAFRLILNSATREKDLNWLTQQAGTFKVTLNIHDDLANIAVQGPQAREIMTKQFPALKEQILSLKPFRFIVEQEIQIACTGYTGEDGFEVILSNDKASVFWQNLLVLGAKPCGLGARDTLRLEAGLNLYGADMDETVTPLESNIGWTVAFDPVDRDFIGRQALEKQREQGDYPCLLGVLLEGRGVLRAGQQVFQQGHCVGVLVSGTFSPTLQQGVGFARVKADPEALCEVDVRGKLLVAKLIKLPFKKRTVK